MEVIRLDSVKAEPINNETRRRYRKDDVGFYMVRTDMEPVDIQKEHSHEEFIEIHIVAQGTVEVSERVDGVETSAEVSAGDVVVLYPPYSHNVKNLSKQPALLYTLKMLPPSVTGQSFADLIKRDWIEYRG